MTDQTKVKSIKGVIELEDGTTSEFQVLAYYGGSTWSQWGATKERLSMTGVVCDAIAAGVDESDECEWMQEVDE